MMGAVGNMLRIDTARRQNLDQVPFVDLARLHNPIMDEIDAAINNTVRTCGFTLGQELAQFEQEFAAYCGVRFAIGVSSGTDALHIALLAVGVGPGDEVITVPNTFIATAEAISMCGATPVFVDIDAQTFNMDASLIETKITAKTTAIVPVHLYGYPANMDEIKAIANRHDLKVIEDACQAHGAVYKGRKAGSIGDAGCFSFYPSKNLGAFGDGGMIVTNDEQIAADAMLLRDHGQSTKSIHTVKGFCSRLDNLQAAILRVKLKYLDEWNESRIWAAEVYDNGLVGAMSPDTESTHVYHLYVIRALNRNELQTKFMEEGICSGVHYPVPIYLQAAYRELGHKEGDFPEAEKAAAEILSLPMFPGMAIEEIEKVTGAVRRHVG